MPRKGRRSLAMKARWLRKHLGVLSDVNTQTPPQPGNTWMTDVSPSCSSYPVTQLPHLEHEGPQIEEPHRSKRQHVRPVRATHSQCDRRYNEFSRNHQCTCMALTFLAYHYEGSQLNTDDLDRVLQQGDSLYVAIKKQLLSDGRFKDNHLTIEEMPMHILTDTNTYNLCMPFMWCGYLKDQGDGHVGWQPLASQLQCLSADVSQALLIVSPECIAVFRDSWGRYGVFDSHSRSSAGLPHPRGTAVMLTFDNLTDMINHLHQLFKECNDNASYEFVPVSFSSDISVVPLPTTTAQTQETKSQTASCIPQKSVLTQTYSRNVHVVKFKDNPVHNAGQGQPVYLDFNLSTDVTCHTTATLKNWSKLSKQVRRKYMQRAKRAKMQQVRQPPEVRAEVRRNPMQPCTWHNGKESPANAALNLHHKLQLAVKIKRKYRLIVVRCPQDPQPEVQPQIEHQME